MDMAGAGMGQDFPGLGIPLEQLDFVISFPRAFATVLWDMTFNRERSCRD